MQTDRRWFGRIPAEVSEKLLDLARQIGQAPVDPARATEIVNELGGLPLAALGDVERSLHGFLWDYSAAYRNQRDRAQSRKATARIVGRVRRWLGWPPRPAESSFDLHSRVMGECPALVPLYLFNRSGYLRQAALDRMVAPPLSPFFLVALAWRMNDWVPEVRRAAKRACERLFPEFPAGVVAAAAPGLMDRWRYWRRWESECVAVIDRSFDRPDVADALAQRYLGDATGRLRTEFRYALRSPRLDRVLGRLATTARHSGVRSAALAALVSGKAIWPISYEPEWIDRSYNRYRRRTVFAERALAQSEPPEPLIRAALRDRAAMVRIVAADALIARRSDFPDVAALAAAMSADRSRAVRERAAFLQRKLGEEGSGAAADAPA